MTYCVLAVLYQLLNPARNAMTHPTEDATRASELLVLVALALFVTTVLIWANILGG